MIEIDREVLKIPKLIAEHEILRQIVDSVKPLIEEDENFRELFEELERIEKEGIEKDSKKENGEK